MELQDRVLFSCQRRDVERSPGLRIARVHIRTCIHQRGRGELGAGTAPGDRVQQCLPIVVAHAGIRPGREEERDLLGSGPLVPETSVDQFQQWNRTGPAGGAHPGTVVQTVAHTFKRGPRQEPPIRIAWRLVDPIGVPGNRGDAFRTGGDVFGSRAGPERAQPAGDRRVGGVAGHVERRLAVPVQGVHAGTGADQQGYHSRVPARGRQVQGRVALRVLNIRIRTRLQQRGHPQVGTIPGDRLVQRERTVRRAPVVDARSGRHEETDDLGLGGFGGGLDCRFPVFRQGVRIRTGLQQGTDQCRTSVLRSLVERRVSILAALVGVRSGRQQLKGQLRRGRGFRTQLPEGLRQRRITIPFRRVDVRAGLQQGGHGGRIAASHRIVERRGPAAVGCIHVCAKRLQPRRDNRIHRGGAVEGGVSVLVAREHVRALFQAAGIIFGSRGATEARLVPVPAVCGAGHPVEIFAPGATGPQPHQFAHDRNRVPACEVVQAVGPSHFKRRPAGGAGEIGVGARLHQGGDAGRVAGDCRNVEWGEAVPVPGVRVHAGFRERGNDPDVFGVPVGGLVQRGQAIPGPGVHVRSRGDEQRDDGRMGRLSRRDEEGGRGVRARGAIGVRARPEALACVLRRGLAEEDLRAPVGAGGVGGVGGFRGWEDASGRRSWIRNRAADGLGGGDVGGCGWGVRRRGARAGRGQEGSEAGERAPAEARRSWSTGVLSADCRDRLSHATSRALRSGPKIRSGYAESSVDRCAPTPWIIP